MFSSVSIKINKMTQEKEKIYIVGNWKMNPPSLDDAETIFDEMENDAYRMRSDKIEAVICMPYLFLSDFDAKGEIKLGAQNLFWESRGAYTGEISSEMLRKVGVKYVIIGHSERRKYLGETDGMVNLKIKACLDGGMRPILCVGETLEERKKGDAGEVIVSQLEQALRDIPEKSVRGKLLIAYEPIWAIGSGTTPSTDDIMGVGLLIKKIISKLYGREIVESTPILYGGSVTSQNCFDLVDKTGLRGLLIGGASLEAREFVGIVKEFVK
ncbi:MAG: triose-phosphate isomerase [Candidatus Paceibacterota bacterium]